LKSTERYTGEYAEKDPEKKYYIDVALLPYVSCWHLALRYWRRGRGEMV
jgi:hypothetical protein